MKLILLIFVIGLHWNAVFAQNPITWSFDYNQEEKQLELSAELEEGWHIYSQFLEEGTGPVATNFEFEENPLVAINAVEEPKVKPIFDENFGDYILYHKNKVLFKVPVIIKESTIVKGSVLYMLCNDSGCLPPDVTQFEIPVIK